MKQKFWKSDKGRTFVFTLTAFVLMTVWALTQDCPGGPDEEMRYQVAQWLYQHPGQLPRGDDESLINVVWGLSYAFYPILSYMVSAVFMWIAAIFGAAGETLVLAARMADVLFVTGAVYFVVKASRRLFPEEGRWLFAALCAFLPQALFLGTYVNTDSLALLSMAILLYAWACVLDEGWTWKNCMLLAVGMAVCALSYYNAYGWILCSFLFFCLTILLCGERRRKERWKFLIQRGAAISAVTLALCGWWFVRNAVLYDGDFLGRRASSQCAEKYAMTDYKPSNYPTPEKLGWTWKDVFFYQDPGWRHNWTITVLVSFIGTFGLMNIYMPYGLSKVYILFFGIGLLGVCTMLGMFHPKKRMCVTEKRNLGAERWKVKLTAVSSRWDEKGIFHLLLVLLMVIPVALFLYYVYYSDNQAQGRYIMPALYPLMYFVTAGWVRLLGRFVKRPEIRSWIYRGIAALLIAVAWGCWFFLILP
ncbi:MAG: DUF2142 domain-containing protein [Clostridiales bacterium]|nr:DUF2142 domain-containing protein [Clostridiales bacterium]